jgi:hypothetical protein
MNSSMISKPYLLGLCLLSVCLTGCSTTEEPTPAPKPETIIVTPALLIDSSPEAEVWANGRLWGTTPLKRQKDDALDYTLYARGFIPQHARANGAEVTLELEPTNQYLYNLLAREKVRFVRRQQLDSLTIEPLNHAVEVGYAYAYYDPQEGREITLVVTEIEEGYLKLTGRNGASLYYPIICP